MVPLGVMRPIRSSRTSVNQRLPSGPAVIAWRFLADVTGNSVILPAGEVAVLFDPPFVSVVLLLLVEFVLPPPPQAVRRSMRRSPGILIRINRRATWEKIDIEEIHLSLQIAHAPGGTLNHEMSHSRRIGLVMSL